jgi:hypothetical protein
MDVKLVSLLRKEGIPPHPGISNANIYSSFRTMTIKKDFLQSA